MKIDLYYTMRSPYCYLATPEIAQLASTYDLQIDLKPVYPLAVSDPTFFERVNPLWPPYVMKDTQRTAKRLNIPFRWPNPDPIAQDPETRQFAADQPRIRRLTRLAQLASEQNLGLNYVVAVSGLLFGSGINGWDQGMHLQQALESIGLDLATMDKTIATEQQRIDAAIAQNREDQLTAGHWGAPLFVYEDEVFFGRDRIDDLVWHLQQQGLQSA